MEEFPCSLEQDEAVGPPNRTRNSAMNLEGVNETMRSIFVLSLAMLVVLAGGCTMPRIMIISDPLTAEEHLQLGIAYEKKGEFDNAIREYEAAEKKTPRAYYYLGNAYFQKREFGKAEFYYKNAINKEASNADAYNNLAWLYCVQGKNLIEAEGLALKAMELNPAKKDTYEDTLERIRKLNKTIE
jgi:tetratricopeptide (TPR) repeat protein